MARHTWNGEVARDLREGAGLKPDEVADHLGVHRATVFAWEAGRDPQLRHAMALADLYGVSIDALFIHEPEADTASNGRGEIDGDRTAAATRSPAPAQHGG